MSRALLLLAAAAACGDTVLVVEVDVRTDLGELVELEVTARNDGDAVSETFDLTGQAFPLTFTITAGGRDGEIELELVARDPAGVTRGAATARGALDGGSSRRLAVRLDPADLVVNTITEGAQRTVFRPGRYGKQVAATGDGGFAVAFVNDCQNPALCDVFVRRFDGDGKPVDVGGSSDELSVNSGSYPEVSVPAIAGRGGGAIAASWEISTAIVFAEIGGDGAVITADTNASDPAALDPIDPAIASLPGGELALVWTQEQIDAANPAGVWQLLAGGAPILLRQEAIAATPALTAAGSSVATCWSEGPALMMAVAPPGEAGAPIAARTFPDGARVLSPNIVATGDRLVIGYGVTGSGEAGLDPAGLFVSSFDAAGAPGPEITIGAAGLTDTVALAVDGDGRIAAVWQGCDELGDGDGCGIFLSLLGADLAPLTEAPLRVNTTVAGDQLAPSVAAIAGGFAVAWTDLSGAPPDSSSAVRARPIYLDALGL